MTPVRGKEKAMIEKKHRYNKDFKKTEEKATESVSQPTEKKASPKEPKKIQKKVKTNSRLNVRSSPEVANNIIKSLANGTIVIVKSEKNGWTKIEEGYVMSKYLEDIK